MLLVYNRAMKKQQTFRLSEEANYYIQAIQSYYADLGIIISKARAIEAALKSANDLLVADAKASQNKARPAKSGKEKEK